MASLATRQGAGISTELATEQAARQAAEQAARQTAQQAQEAAAERAAKAARDAAQAAAARQASEQAARQAAEQAARQAAEQAAEQAAKKASKLSAADAAKYAAAAAAAGLGVYTYVKANDAAEASNKTPRGITKIEYASSSSKSVLKITFTPAMRILVGDDLKFRDTKTTPSIDGPATVKSVTSNSQIVVDFGSTQVTNLKEGGFIDVKTTAGAQAAAIVTDAGKDLGNAGKGFLGGFLPDWLTNPSKTMKIIFIVIIVLIILGILGFVLSQKNKKQL
jgi:predicted hydrocarbon binding protein